MDKIPLSPTPDDYTETKLYKTLAERDKVKNTGLCEKVDYLIKEVTPILQTIGRGVFNDFTLHTPLHSCKLLHLAGYIIPKETLDYLSELELAVLIMSFYFHDIGMVVSEKRKDEILKSEDFRIFLDANKDYYEKISNLRKEIARTPDGQKPIYEEHLAQLHYAALTKYLRPKHSEENTYKQALTVVERERQDLFSYGGSSFRDEFVILCHSHNETTSYLNKQDADGEQILKDSLYYKDQRLNLQYCAAVLRLADILDFDDERTPKSLFRSLGIEDKKLPGFKVSLKEWTKQMSVCSIVLTDREIEVQSECDSPSIEYAVKEMCQSIEREIRDTSSFISKAPKEISEHYKINLPLLVTPKIKRRGYADKQYSIHLDESSITTLLMGENLYDRVQVAMRELLQNAIDACVLREKLDNNIPSQIFVSVSRDADDRVWVMVRDNGIGMDDKVLSDFFFSVGKSYYKSADFRIFSAKKSIKGFVPISRFGIGILSVFMIGDALKVTTQNKFSDDNKHRIIFIDPNSMAVVHESTKNEPGTTIELRLKREYGDEKQILKLFQYVHEVFIHPSVPISLTDLDGKTTTIVATKYRTLPKEKKDSLKKENIEIVELDLGRYSDVIRGNAILFLFVNTDGTLSYSDKTGEHKWGMNLLKFSDLMPSGTAGNRLTVNGVLMHMRKQSKLLKAGKHRFYSFMDVEIDGTDAVSYDVTRTKIVGKGQVFVKKEIKKAVALGLKKEGVYDRFDDMAKSLFSALFEDYK